MRRWIADLGLSEPGGVWPPDRDSRPIDLARNLWLQGFPDQAIEWAHKAVKEASAADHSLTLAVTLIWAISVFLWTGDLQIADAYVDLLIARAESHCLAPYLLVARGLKSEIVVRRGDAKAGSRVAGTCKGFTRRPTSY